jgi:N-carbamoylputrescine amidase
MLEHVRVAAAAMDAKPGETGHNLDSIEAWAHRAAADGASLLLLPELSLTGFLPNHPTASHESWLRDALAGARRMAEPVDGPAVRRLVAIARATGLLVAAGLLEDAGGLLYNTHVLAGPAGVLGAWRKMHVPLFEMPLYNGGGGPTVVDTPLGRIGITICIDAFLPESVRLLAVQGAEIVLFPFAADPAPLTPEGWATWAEPTVRARCRENGVFGVACNLHGEVEFAGASQAFAGGALVIDPGGQEIARHTEDTRIAHMLLADLDRDRQLEARSAFEYTFRLRRPDLYGPLTRG